MKKVIPILFAAAIGLVGCQGEDSTLMGSHINGEPASPATKAVALTAVQDATVLLQVTQSDGSPAVGMNVVFARAIAGLSASETWTGSTDAKGQVTLSIQTSNGTGYFTARVENASGQLVGHWHSIPINGNDDNIFTLPIGGKILIHPGGPRVTTMTRNIYLGADINRVLAPSNAETPIPLLVAQTWGMVQKTNFAERAKALANEIAQALPHLIGLQEVTLYRIQNPGDFLTGNPVKATAVSLDQLAILLDELKARGLDYRAVAISEGVDIEIPMAISQTAPLADIRLTDREVILARGDVQVANVVEKKFQAALPVTLGGIPITIPRA
jgi:hypothetical protein